MMIACLTHLFTPNGLLVDGDGDGLPDGFGCTFSVGAAPGAIDVAARLGLESAAFTPGFTAGPSECTVWFGPENPACPPVDLPEGCGMVALVEGGVVVTGTDARQGLLAAQWLAASCPAGLPAGRPITAVILRDGAVVDVRYGEGSVAPAVDKPFVETAPAEAPFAAEPPGDLPPPGPARLFTTAGLMGSSDGVQHDRTTWQVAADGLTPPEVAGLCELAARTGVEAAGLLFPFVGGDSIRLTQERPDDAEWVEDGLAWSGGRLTVYGATPEERAEALHRAARAGLVDGVHATLFTRRAALPPEPLPEGEVLFDLAIQQQWEVDRFRQVWQEQVLPRLEPGTPVSVDLRLSEPLDIREALAEEMAAGLGTAGIPEAAIRVLSAYKQGFHWLEEEVLPSLQAAGPIARVEVTAARFEGAASGAPATLGGGAEPKAGTGGELRGTEGAARHGEPLELPIRWLQELYPADELLSSTLGADVRFNLAEQPQEHVYLLKAYRPDGTLAANEGFSPVHAARLYLPEFPQRGRVHPPTGLLKVTQSDRVIAELAIDTDAEAFWTTFQEQVLPRLRGALGESPDAANQPFFGKLVVEVAASEDDRRLNIREEQISPLDALHEDIYFYTLDYLNELGLSLTGKPWPAPGAVEPWVVAGEGGLTARVRLYARPALNTAHVDHLPKTAAELPERAAESIPDDVVIGPDQLPHYLAYLAKLPGVKVWRAGLSFGGRPTWALSVAPPTAGAIAPPQKLSAWRPTLLVNARRHANEVSSTNSILRLAELAATQGLGINLVLSPMENADGAAVHYAMQQQHPTWKLHAARFNAAGVDFGFDCFAGEPRFGESRTLPTLWRGALPDVFLDDHGYPSHEWVQPFSGYNSPPYFPTSWWMPNAAIYGIHRMMDPEQFPANAAVQDGLRDALAERLTADPEIEGYTRTLLERFVTYGQRHVPAKFPLEMHNGFVSLARRVKAGPTERTFVGRFPHITLAELITEVPDETAQGDYLKLCAKAHLEGDLAVVNYLARTARPVVRRRSTTPDGRTLMTVGRDRS